MSRPETRYRADFQVHINWQDQQGAVRSATGRCIDLSASGALITMLDPVTRQSIVVLHSDKFGRMGHATVRYCRRAGMKYQVGLLFSVPLVLGDSLRKEFLDRASSGA